MQKSAEALYRKDLTIFVINLFILGWISLSSLTAGVLLYIAPKTINVIEFHPVFNQIIIADTLSDGSVEEEVTSTETVEREEALETYIVESEPVVEETVATETTTVETTAANTQTQDPTVQDLFENEISLIPSNQLEFLRSRGWSWEITGMNLAQRYGYSVGIVGITDYSQKTIYITNRSNKIRRATIHEFGHALAAELGDVDETEEFYEIFYDERDNFHDCTNTTGDGHNTVSTDEYFASVYQNMILNYDETYADVPRTVEYIERVLSVI